MSTRRGIRTDVKIARLLADGWMAWSPSGSKMAYVCPPDMTKADPIRVRRTTLDRLVQLDMATEEFDGTLDGDTQWFHKNPGPTLSLQDVLNENAPSSVRVKDDLS